MRKKHTHKRNNRGTRVIDDLQCVRRHDRFMGLRRSHALTWSPTPLLVCLFYITICKYILHLHGAAAAAIDHNNINKYRGVFLNSLGRAVEVSIIRWRQWVTRSDAGAGVAGVILHTPRRVG